MWVARDAVTKTLKGRHAPDATLTPRDLVGKLDVLALECPKCERTDRYALRRLVDQRGRDVRILNGITADCPPSGFNRLTT
jgi:hypothetical protein